MRIPNTARLALGGLLFACTALSIACTGSNTTNDTGATSDSGGGDAARDAMDTGSIADTSLDSMDTSPAADATDTVSTMDSGFDGRSTDAVATDGASSDAGSADTGPSPCERACEHVFTCTGVTCASLGVDCATTPIGECTGDCIAMTSCSALTVTTPMTCQSMCASDGGTADAGSTDASTDGGAAPCERACDHVFACTGITCATLGVDCATTPVDDCTGDCIAATPCTELDGTTPTTCQMRCAADGGTSDAATDAPSSDAGGDRMACSSCSTTRCLSAVNTCFSDPTCNAWLLCVSACTDNACVLDCDSMYPTASPRYAPVYACQCAMCSSECAYADPCAR